MIAIAPVPGEKGYVIVSRFDSHADLLSWRSSDERQRLISASSSLVEEQPRERELSGMESWFSTPGGEVPKAPPAWKMWLLSSVAMYPLLTLLTLMLGPLVAGAPLVAKFAITPPLLGPLVTWIVMPRLSRLAEGWLYN